MRFLTPTENKRFNELVGFLCVTLAVLTALALISYSPRDPALNVSASPSSERATQNWIGPAGAYSSDLLFQCFGYAAFLLPVALAILGWRWLRSQPVTSQLAKLIGYALMLLSLPSLLSLWHLPAVRDAVPAGGLAGSLIAGGLLSGFNSIGANLVGVALFLTALFMTTRFSFSGTHAWATGPRGPVGAAGKLGLIQRTQARWRAYESNCEASLT